MTIAISATPADRAPRRLTRRNAVPYIGRTLYRFYGRDSRGRRVAAAVTLVRILDVDKDAFYDCVTQQGDVVFDDRLADLRVRRQDVLRPSRRRRAPSPSVASTHREAVL